MKVAGDQRPSNGKYGIRSFVDSGSRKVLARRHSGHIPFEGSTAKRSIVNGDAPGPKLLNGSGLESESSIGVISSPVPIRIIRTHILPRPTSMPELMAATAAAAANGMPPLPKNASNTPEKPDRPHSISHFRPPGKGDPHGTSNGRGRPATPTLRTSAIASQNNNDVSSDGKTLRAAFPEGDSSTYVSLVNDSRASTVSSLQVGSVTSATAYTSQSSNKKSHRVPRSAAWEGRTRTLTRTSLPSFKVPPEAKNTGKVSLDSPCVPPSSNVVNVSAGEKFFGGIRAIERRARSLSTSRRSSRTSRSSSPSSSSSGTSHSNCSVGKPSNGTTSRWRNDTSDSSQRRRSSSFGRRSSRTSSGSSSASAGNNRTSPIPGEDQTKLRPAIEAAEVALAAASAAESPEFNHPAKHPGTVLPASASSSGVRSSEQVALSPGDGAVSRNSLQNREPASTTPQVCDEPAPNLPLSLNNKLQTGTCATIPGQAERWEAAKYERVSILRPPRPQGRSEDRDESQGSLSSSTRGGRAARTVCLTHDSDDESGFSSEYESDDEDKAKRSERQSSANHADGVGVSSRFDERKLSFGSGTSRAAAAVSRSVDGVKINKVAPIDVAKGGGVDVPDIRMLTGRERAGRTGAVRTSEWARVGVEATVLPILTTTAAFHAEGSKATLSADGGERKPSSNEGDEQRAGSWGGGGRAQEPRSGEGGDLDGLPRLLSTPGRLSSGSSLSSSSSSRPSFASRLGGEDGLVEAFAIARGRAEDIRSLASGRAAAELGGLLRQAILGDWHTCAMPKHAPPRWKVEERAEWDAWVASEGVTKSEAMRIFTAAVNDLCRQKKEGIWPSPDKNASRYSSNTNIKIDVNPNLGDKSVGGLALSAAPLFAGPVSISPEKDKKGPRTPNESAPSPPADTTSRTEVNSPVLPGSGVAVEEAKEAVGWRRGPGAGGTSPSSASFRDGNNVLDASGAAPVAVEAKDGPAKAGVLYKKREVLPGWRPRTFMLDARQRLLRYYLPSSARPRGSISLEGCSVGRVVVGSEGKGESGPEGRRLFRIKLVAGPAPVPSGKGVGDDGGRRSFLGSPAGDTEGFRKTHVLAATSPEEADAWVAAIQDAAVYRPPPPVEIPATDEVNNSNHAATEPGSRWTSNTRREDRSFEDGSRNSSMSLAASLWPAASNNGSKKTVRAAHGRDAVARAGVTNRQIDDQYEPAVCASMAANDASATVSAGSGAEEGDKGGVGSAVSKGVVRGAAVARLKLIAAVAVEAPLIVYVAAPVILFLLSISSNGGSIVSVIALAAIVAMAAPLGSRARARQQSRRDVARWDQDQGYGTVGLSTSTELDSKEEEDSQRFTVGFSVDVQSLQAELDRLREGGVRNEQDTWNSVSGSSVVPGVGSRGTSSMEIAGDAGDAKGTSWQHGSTATSVITGDSARGVGLGRAARSDRSRTAEATVNSPPAATASVTVLHLVMKAAADSLLDAMPHPFLPRAHESITPVERGSSIGFSETLMNAYANGSPRANLGGVPSGNAGSGADERRRPTRVACAVTQTPIGGTGDGRGGTAGVRGRRALVIVESAEAKSASAIATEIATAAAASLGSTRRELLAARLRSEVASTSSGLEGCAGFSSNNNAAFKRVPLFLPAEPALASLAVCRPDAPGQQVSGQTVGMRFAGTPGVPDTRAFGENSPEEHRTWWSAALAGRRAELSAEKRRQNGIPLLHADNVASLARSWNGGCSGRGSGGGASKMTVCADCLVEIKSSATPASFSSKRASSNSSGDRSQRGRVRFAENTFPVRDDRKPSTARRSSWDPTDRLELEDEREEEEQPLEVAVIPDPGGEGVASALRVTVGPVSALKGSERRGSAGSGGLRRVTSGKTGAPVIVLQVSVVGAGRIGAAVTLEFAEALRRRLLGVGPSD